MVPSVKKEYIKEGTVIYYYDVDVKKASDIEYS